MGKTIDYKKPPLNELVFGIQFKSLDSFLAPHTGRLWEKLRKDFPNCEEKTPLSPVIELFDQETRLESVELLNAPPLPRIWFVDSLGNKIIQIQRDRFHFNWRKVKSDDEYPRYTQVFLEFKKRFEIFQQFLEETNLGAIKPSQYELSYVNHILSDEGWQTLNDIGQVFPDLSWRKSIHQKFTSNLENVTSRFTFALPEQQGRLHVTIRGLQKTQNKSLISLDLTIRGIPKNKSLDEMATWFENAHQGIITAFNDLTAASIQTNIWGKFEK